MTNVLFRSVVKAATLTRVGENNAISGNQVRTDQPISFGGTDSITSWFTQNGSRAITAQEALEYSSNTYMVQVALKMMGTPYSADMKLDFDELDPSMKSCARPCRVWSGHLTGLICQMSPQAIFQISLPLLTI